MSSGVLAAPLPVLTKRSDLYIERPRRARLMHHVKDLLGDVRRLDEELFGLVEVEPVACPGHVDHGVEVEVRDVNTPRAEIACERLGEVPLGSLGEFAILVDTVFSPRFP